MSTRTLAELRTEARQRADMENDDLFVSDAELTRMVNESIKELYDLLVSHQDHSFYLTSTSGNTVAGTASYALPSAFYRLVGVDVTIGTDVYSIRPFSFAERNKFRNDSWTAVISDDPNGIRYRINGSNITFSPTPQAVHSYTLWYTPQFTDLPESPGTATFDGINGWEEYVVVDCAMKMLEKEESDVSHLQVRKAMLIERIKALATDRDAGGPATVIDIYEMNADRWL